jgi:hypothetical protein
VDHRACAAAQSATRDALEPLRAFDAGARRSRNSILLRRLQASEGDVWSYVRALGVPYNRLHDEGYTASIGCAPWHARRSHAARIRAPDAGGGKPRPPRSAACTSVADGRIATALRKGVAASTCRPPQPHPPRTSVGRAAQPPRWLESEAIHILREVAAECANPVLLFSGGKDSIVHAAAGARRRSGRGASRSRCCTSTPATTSRGDRVPRRAARRELGARLVVRSVEDSIDARRACVERSADGRRNRCQTVDAARRDRASSASTPHSAARAATRRRPAPRSASSRFRDEFGQWDPKNQRPELWNLYNAPRAPGRAHARVPAVATGPSSTSGSTSAARRLERAVDLLRGQPRQVVRATAC